MRVLRRFDQPPRRDQTWDQLWNGPDGGLIVSWERGREKAREDPELASAASRGELVVLPWKGGVARATKVPKKYGPLFYLAMWQGLRAEALDIETDKDTTVVCSRTGMVVTFTADISKYSQQT
jgi:hypothetical protein